MKKRIAVIGSDGTLPENVSEMAYQIGRDIAKNKCVLICGGRGGVMEQACKGAKEAGGITCGILPSNNHLEANEYVDVAITTGIGYIRNSFVVSSCDAVIALHGSIGTLSEIAMALNLDKPVYAVKGSGGITGKIKKLLEDDIRGATVTEVDAEKAVETALLSD